MNTYNKEVVSPFQPRINRFANSDNPVSQEVRNLCNTSYTLEVSFQEDVDTLKQFRHIPNLIAIMCIIKKDGQVISLGRSWAVFSRLNKYLERTISTAINGSFLSATNNASKVLESFRMSVDDSSMEPDLATDKQKNYLNTLIQEKVPVNERDNWIKELSNISRSEASDKIACLLNNY